MELKSQKRRFLVILVIVFIGFVGISIPYLIFPPLFLHVKYSFLPSSWGDSSRALLLGITLAVYPLGQFFGSPILGALSDDYGRKHLLSGSLILSSVCSLLTGIAVAKQYLILLVISRFVAGFMEGNVAIARAMCADLKMLPKPKTLGRINAAISIAYLLGPFLGGVLTDKRIYKGFTASTPFYVICLLFLFTALLANLILTNSSHPSKKDTRTLRQRLNFMARTRALFSNKTVKRLILISTSFTLAVDIFYEFAPVYLTAKWMLTPGELMVYNGVLCIGLALGNAWLPTLIASRSFGTGPTAGAIGGFALFLSGILFSNTGFFMLIWFALIGLVIGLGVTLLTVQISDSVSDNIQGEVMGTQLSLRVLGDGMICLLGGVLLVFSAKIILTVSAVLSLSTMVYFKKFRRRAPVTSEEKSS